MRQCLLLARSDCSLQFVTMYRLLVRHICAYVTRLLVHINIFSVLKYLKHIEELCCCCYHLSVLKTMGLKAKSWVTDKDNLPIIRRWQLLCFFEFVIKIKLSIHPFLLLISLVRSFVHLGNFSLFHMWPVCHCLGNVDLLWVVNQNHKTYGSFSSAQWLTKANGIF